MKFSFTAYESVTSSFFARIATLGEILSAWTEVWTEKG